MRLLKILGNQILDKAITASKLAAGAVTYAKMQDISAASRLLGRGSAGGSGDPEEISVGTGLSMSGTTLAVASTIVDTTGTPADNQVAIFTDANTIEGNAGLTFDGTNVTTSGDVILSADKLIRRNTSDGSDSGSIELHGGGATGQTRGSYVRVHGNEHSTAGGDLHLQPGNAAGAEVIIGRGSDGADTIVVTNTGVVSLPIGQVKFPASQNASSDANTIDDYEEGTWTPRFSDGTNDATHSLQSGTYVKIGQLVFIALSCTMATKASMVAGSALNILGLPFACNTQTAALSWGVYNNFATGYSAPQAIVNASASSINFYVTTSDAAGTSNSVIQVSNVNATFHVNLSGCYRTTA